MFCLLWERTATACLFPSHRGLNKQGYKCRRECFIDPPPMLPAHRLVAFFQVEIFVLFTQNAMRQSTRGASKKSLASALDLRPTVVTLWWAELMFEAWRSKSVSFPTGVKHCLSDGLSPSGTLSKHQSKPHKKWLLLMMARPSIVPERALQDWHAASLQDLQLQESHLLRPLRQPAVGPVQARPQVWRWGHTFFLSRVKQKLCRVSVTLFFLTPPIPPYNSLLPLCVSHTKPSKQTVAWTFIVTARRKWPISAESTRSYCQRLCLKSPRFAPHHCCVHLSEGNKQIIDFLSYFVFFRNHSRSLKNQVSQTLESIRMSVKQQQTLVVRQRKTSRWSEPFLKFSLKNICHLLLEV